MQIPLNVCEWFKDYQTVLTGKQEIEHAYEWAFISCWFLCIIEWEILLHQIGKRCWSFRQSVCALLKAWFGCFTSWSWWIDSSHCSYICQIYMCILQNVFSQRPEQANLWPSLRMLSKFWWFFFHGFKDLTFVINDIYYSPGL